MKRHLLDDRRQPILGGFARLLLSVAILALTFGQTQSIRNPMRSVKVCGPTGPATTSQECNKYCQYTYIEVSLNMIEQNANLAQSRLHETANGTAQCCCMFNAPWPRFVRPDLIGRSRIEARQKTGGLGECLPLLIWINLSTRTKEAYKELCHYLAKSKPLTILELMKFVDAAHYLNFMAPRHPALWNTLRQCEVKSIQNDAVAELEAQFDDLMDTHYGPIELYGGQRLDTSQLKKFLSIKGKLQQALRSRIVAKAFDELVMSHVAVDIVVAASQLRAINQRQLSIPDALLQGHYDSYDTDNRAAYFALPLDCQLLGRTSARLTAYLSAVRSLLSSLHEKLVYENMLANSAHLKELVHAQEVYKYLLEVNCKNNNNKGPASGRSLRITA